MFKFTDAERIVLGQSRAISTDADGNEILVGLTIDETRQLIEHRRKFSDEIYGRGQRERDPAIKKHCAALNEKHETARLAVIGAEAQLNAVKPTKH